MCACMYTHIREMVFAYMYQSIHQLLEIYTSVGAPNYHVDEKEGTLHMLIPVNTSKVIINLVS